MGAAVRNDGWRGAWATLGWVLLAIVPVSWLLQRNTPEELGQTLDVPAMLEATLARGSVDFTLGERSARPRFGSLRRDGSFQSRLVRCHPI